MIPLLSILQLHHQRRKENEKSIHIVLVLAFVMAIPAHAADTNTAPTAISGNNLRIVDRVTIESPNTRSNDTTATRTKTFYNGDTLIAEISFKTTFRYDGSSVSGVSKSVTQTDTYGGWSYKEESFTSSSGTVTLTGKLKYLLIFNPTTFTMSMTCDANGNISY